MTAPTAPPPIPAVRPAHATAVLLRNLTAARRASSLWVLLSGLFEPVFYLGAIGLGVGTLIGGLTVDGRSVDYPVFVAPAMLAASLMNGAVAESTFAFFTRLRTQKLYDATAATPVSAADVVCGEAAWSVLKGTAHALPFLVLLCALDLLEPRRVPALVAACLLVGAAFAALGLVLGALLRGTHQFDRVNLVTFTMFVFSGTFAPTGDYPPVLEALARYTPLAQAVDLCRALALGTPGWSTVIPCAYLLALTAGGLLLAARRVDRSLRG